MMMEGTYKWGESGQKERDGVRDSRWQREVLDK